MGNSQRLHEELQSQKHALAEADLRNAALLESRKTLMSNLDEEVLKQRHYMLELCPSTSGLPARSDATTSSSTGGGPCVFSSRSEVSTACTVRDLSTPPPKALCSKGCEKDNEVST